MKHPEGFLTHGKTLSQLKWNQLRENCSSIQQGPSPHNVTFHFQASDINDIYDRTIIANTTDNTFRCLPLPHCCCHKPPLNCECMETLCTLCGKETTSTSTSCEDEFCITEGCGLCSHQREECSQSAPQVQQDLQTRREQASREYPQECIAHAYILAIREVLAPGVGETPLFPATKRFLDRELGQMKDDAWQCSDGSRITKSDMEGWLQYEP